MQETGNSPVTGESLSLEDLVAIKADQVRLFTFSGIPLPAVAYLFVGTEPVAVQAVKPRPSPATSIPGLLGLFHNVRVLAAAPPAGLPSQFHVPRTIKFCMVQCICECRSGTRSCWRRTACGRAWGL